MATGQRILKGGGPRTADLDQHRALLQRVLWSREIEKSVRIRDFLAFVCDRALRDPSAAIHEQEIGCRIFGRPADYDTTADNIVRVTASQARKKLERYFANEGTAEPVILEIPKGQYIPVFHERDLPTGEPGAERHADSRPTVHRRTVWILAASTVLLAIVVVALAVMLHNARMAARSELDANPTLHALWSQLLTRDCRTDIVLADSSLSLFQELLDRQLTLSEFLKPDLWGQANGLSSNPELQAFARKAAQRNFTSLGSVTTAYRIAQLVGRDLVNRVSILSARDFNVRQMKTDNVILLGSSRANPWAELIADRLNFRFGYDQQSRYSYFENREPRPGELKMYRTDSSTSYCQLAFLPSLGKSANILAISGTEVEGTEGGGEFATTERSLAQVRSFAPPDGDGRMPYFEILLKSTRVGGAAPSFSIVAFRKLRP